MPAREPLWRPSPESAASSTMAGFVAAASALEPSITSSVDLHRWSLADPGDFWSLVWDHFDVLGEPGEPPYIETDMPAAVFFPHARLNLAENLLMRGEPDALAVTITGETESGIELREELTRTQLRRRVAALASRLRAYGVQPGDRVGLILPAAADATVATLAALTVGAVVSSVSPEFGAPSIVDRLGQLEPRVIVGAASYRWSGREFRRVDNLAEVVRSLPSVELVLVSGDDAAVSELAGALPGCRVEALADVLATDGGDLSFEQLPFDHPAYVLFSSGTTGKPKCLIHRAGGVLLKHLVELGLHSDVRAGDRLLFYTTTSWMMWNWELSGLAVGATVALHDGAPAFPDPPALFRAATLVEATHLGLGARLLDHMRSEGVLLRPIVRGTGPRMVLVTGSPLSEPTAQWLADQLGPDVMINPISGGTDIVGCFVAGDPTRPFFAGEMAGPVLGTAVDVYTDDAVAAADGEVGELVCTQPFPTVPLGIWGDETGERLRQTYFDRWPGVWVHGDRAVRSAEGGIAILGRSDATLNVAGVRIGTAEIYSALATMPEVADSLAFAQEWEGDTRIVLLVVPAPGVVVDDDMRQRVAATIRSACSPRHVPGLIVPVRELPRTQTGKITEIAVREAVHGREVKGAGALANPQALDEIVDAVRSASAD
jgi:acetoacetyl-CoA synthetase